MAQIRRDTDGEESTEASDEIVELNDYVLETDFTWLDEHSL
jgi:hypothetical protein